MPDPASITIVPELPRPGAAPRPVASEEATAALRQLLRIEAELRRAATRDELGLALVNESRKLARARQVFAVEAGPGGRPRIWRISGVAAVERGAPLVRWLEDVAGRRLRAPSEGPPTRQALDLRAEAAGGAAAEVASYPFPQALWIPLGDRAGAVVGALMLTREDAWDEEATALAVRLAETGAHALLALQAAPRRRLARLSAKPWLVAGTVLALAALAIPVPMTVLAPAEVVAERPFVVSAPLDGVIEEIAVAPNGAVRAGDVVVRYVDTAQRNAFQVAQRDVAVAQARLKQGLQAAFFDEKARRDVGQARAELALKEAERDYARDTFARTSIRAERDGVAVYADRKEWFGKPVATGQRLLEIADPARVEIRVDLPVSDAVALEPGARVRLFPDADPLRPIEAEVAVATPLARLTEAGVLAYRVTARLPAPPRDEAPELRGVGAGEAAPAGAVPRLGIRGTAQLFGRSVPLGLFLFRKPLAWARQKAGL